MKLPRPEHGVVRRIQRLALSTRLTLLALATLCPIAALTVFSYYNQQQQRRDDAQREAGAYSRSVATSLDNFANDLESLTLAAALSFGSQQSPSSPANDQAYIQSLLNQSPMLRALFVTDLNGQVLVTATGENIGLDLSSRPYIQALQQGADTYWSGGLEGSQTGQVTVAFARTIKRPDGSRAGYLAVAFYPAALSDRLAQPADGHLVVFDQAGKLLFSATSDKGTNPNPSPGEATSSPPVAGALAGREVSFESTSIPFDSGERFGSMEPIPTMDWGLGFSRSQAKLDATVRSAFERDIAILALIGFISIMLLLLVARQTARPLAALSRAARKMQQNQPFLLPQTSGDPDVERLREAFLDMHSAVIRREEEMAEQARVLDTLEHAGALLAADLDFAKTVQGVTDAGVRVTEAAFGALFYNMVSEDGKPYQLFTVSGTEASSFDGFGLPRNTELFGPTFRGEGPIRIGDVSADGRYGKLGPHFGMPKGHPPVRSYMAVPVLGRHGGVIGALFFGHLAPNMFSERHEALAVGIASWASIALDNARLYQDSQEKQLALLEANRAKDEFLDLVSHELRTPITVILGGAGYLIERGESGRLDSEREVLSDIRDGAQRLSNLVQNILILAHGERFGNDEREPILVRKLLADMVRELRARSPERQVELSLSSPSLMVLGSQLYLEQALGNLLSNADKYSPKDRPIRVEVEVVVNEGTSNVRIAVLDQGQGLSDEDRTRLFEPYYRGTEARRRATGFGLGLAVCRQLVEAMNGSLWFEEPPEGGAVFIISLPAEGADLVDVESLAEEPGSEDKQAAAVA